jgi:hypothetical protein
MPMASIVNMHKTSEKQRRSAINSTLIVEIALFNKEIK